MNNVPPADFSFDLYPGLDADLEAAYERNIEAGLVTAEDTATSGLASVIGNKLQQTPNNLLSKETHEWAKTELTRAYTNWLTFDHLLTDQTLEGLLDNEGNWEPQLEPYADILEHLYEARRSLIASGEETIEGVNVGETMHLAIVPWQVFKDNLSRLPQWVRRMRTAQTIKNEDFFNSDLLKGIKNGTLLYRYPDANIDKTWLSPAEYLDQKIAQDGPAGIMLVQTSNSAGIKRLVEGPAEERSPNALTNNGGSRFKIANQAVDQFGIFEWLALSFQEDPQSLSSADYSWMLANRIEVGGDPYVPYGAWFVDQVRSNLVRAGFQGDDVRPRLAVM